MQQLMNIPMVRMVFLLTKLESYVIHEDFLDEGDAV